MTRFLHHWLVATFFMTATIGAVTSWTSTTLTLPLDIGAAVGLVTAAVWVWLEATK